MSNKTQDTLSVYFSLNNLKKLISVFDKFLIDKYNINALEIGLNLKKDLFNIMQKIKDNPLSGDMSVQELNKITLQTLRDIIKNNNVIAKNEIIKKKNIAERDMQLYKDRENKFLDNTNINTVSNNDKLPKVEEQFTKIEEDRKSENVKEEFKNNIPSDEIDQIIPEEDFLNKIKTLEDDRKKFYEDNVITNMADSIKNQLMTSTNELTNERNNFDLSQFKSLQELDPKEIYAQSEMIKNIETNQIVNEPIRDIQPSFPLIKKDETLKDIFNEKYICINSFDRDWITQRNRYNYLVKFNYVHKTSQKVEIYENNPTIPNTKTNSSSGIPNIAGYIDENGGEHDAYDSTQGLGAVIGYEYIEVLIDDNINVQTNFKDIYSLEVTKVVIPIDISGALNGRLYNFNFNFPYLLLQIDEFKDIYEGTDDAIRKSFCQLVYESTYQSSNGRGYVVLKPVQREKKIFYPNVLPTMPSLTFSIKTPHGQLFNESMDGYSILKIEYEPFNKYYLKVVTNQYFDKNEFYNGDIILIKKFNIYKISATQNSDNITLLNNFINREEGHEITKIGSANDNSFYQTFYIKAPGAFDNLTGTYVLTKNPSDTTEDNSILVDLQTFNDGMSQSLSSNPVNGFVLNMSLQNSISMKIVTKTKENPLLEYHL